MVTQQVATPAMKQLTKYGDVSFKPGEIVIKMNGGVVRIRLRGDPTATTPTVLVRPTWEPVGGDELAVPLVDGSVVTGILAKFDLILKRLLPDPLPLTLGDRYVIRQRIASLSDTQIALPPRQVPARDPFQMETPAG